MKNDNPIFPFPFPGDKFFDQNNDGELDNRETMFRDIYLIEMAKKQDKNNKK